MTDPSTTSNALHNHGQIYLTGYRGSGKTSVAHALATQINRSAMDLDAEIVAAAGKSIAEIFRCSGEDVFREWETKCLIAESAKPPAIISLGGGAVMRQQNRIQIAQTGVCIWLDADPMTIIKRLVGDDATASQRPTLTGLPLQEEVTELMNMRRPVYKSVSDLRIDTSGVTIEEVAKQIAKWLTLPNKG